MKYALINRIGEHVCYINNKQFKTNYPEWDITNTLDNTLMRR